VAQALNGIVADSFFKFSAALENVKHFY